MSKTCHGIPCVLILLLCLMFSGIAGAQGFSALVSPPRFEDRAKAGTTYRNIIEISNVSARAAHYTLRTADWTLGADNTASFSDTLAPASCRPWVGIEAPEITIGPNAKRRYRFEVQVPPGTPSGECRFAIMIEGDPETAPGGLAVPFSGRLGVIVYLRIGDAGPKLEVVGRGIRSVDGRDVPVLTVRNSGNAHGRLQGFIDGKDGNGHGYSFAPSSFPIMPGETREVALSPQGDDDSAPAPVLVYPVHLAGKLDWGGAERLGFEATFSK